MSLSVSLSFLLRLLPLAFCSFYDNPELELPTESGTPLDALKAKWDFEVSSLPSCWLEYQTARKDRKALDRGMMLSNVYSGGFQASQHLHISDM